MPPDFRYSCCFPSHFRILYTLVVIFSHSSQISNHLIFYSRYYFLTFCISKLCFKYLLGIVTHWKGDNWGLLIFVKNSQGMPLWTVFIIRLLSMMRKENTYISTRFLILILQLFSKFKIYASIILSQVCRWRHFLYFAF